MSSLVSEELRRIVASRADHLCEYCLIHEDDALLRFQVDHILSRKHGGPTDIANLAFACAFCNRHKGSDLGTRIPGSRNLVGFFDPRNDVWAVHFRLIGARIEPLDQIGEGTERIFQFNEPERLVERESLISIGRYPCISAMARMRG